MASKLKIKVNGLVHSVTASLDAPLLYVLHNELHLHGPRFGCRLAQCGACSVLLDGKEIRSCVTPVAAVSGKAITTLEGLPVGGRVATGSVRRRAQLAHHRPDLTFAGLRGNIETRLRKAAEFDAAVVAAVALQRLGRSEVIAELLDPSVVVPQVGQGALAVECRADDTRTRELLDPIEHRASRVAVDAERAWLREIGSGCDLPVGAHATVADDGTITLTAMLGTLDGRVLLRTRGRGSSSTRRIRIPARAWIMARFTR